MHPLSPEGLSLLPTFQKRGPDRISIFRDRLPEKRGGSFEQGEGGRDRTCYIKNKLKSEVLNKKKKNYKRKCLSSITKNLNCQILTKNLVTFKR